jgi:putative NADH-flavin reductase
MATMKILLLGATGRTGRLVLAQAIERGHDVTALVRSAAKMGSFYPRLSIREGDPLSAPVLEQALPGHEAVISALGPVGRGPMTVHADGARALTAAMGKTIVRRLLVVSTGLCFEGIGLIPAFLRRFVFKNIVEDSRNMERCIEQSQLDWTIVRPPRLLDGAGRGKYRAQEKGLPPGGSTIDRADLAHALLDFLEQRVHVHAVVGVAR